MVVIFAGYPKEMKEFLERNPGLKSRIAYHVEFENYNPQQLLEIANLIAGEKGIRLSEEAQNYIIPIFESAVKAEDFGNGRFARNLVEQAILNQAVRLSKRDYSTVTSDELTTLTAEDFTNLAVDTVSEISQPKAKRIGF
jgi:hypothetical protein